MFLFDQVVQATPLGDRPHLVPLGGLFPLEVLVPLGDPEVLEGLELLKQKWQ